MYNALRAQVYTIVSIYPFESIHFEMQNYFREFDNKMTYICFVKRIIIIVVNRARDL